MKFITNTDSTILPYNDSEMVYNLSKRQYQLTPTGFEALTGMKLDAYTDSPDEVNSFLIEISDDIYEYVYSFSNLNTVDYKRFTIAKNGDIRSDFKNALVNHARASLRSGMNLLKDMHGVSVEKSKALDKSTLMGHLGGNAVRILTRIGLLYSGYLAQPNNYVEDGTY
jgi:hypothetical protein